MRGESRRRGLFLLALATERLTVSINMAIQRPTGRKRSARSRCGGVETTNAKGGSFKGRAPKAPAPQQAPRGPQGRRPAAMPVMRIAARGKSGGRGK
jgi:hypothetical protein